MMTWIREKFGTVTISIIIGLIAMVFVFFGVFSPKNTSGLHEGAVAGTVDGTPVSIAEFNQAYRRQVDFFKNLGGGQLDEEQMERMGIKQSVFQQLAKRKVMIALAADYGLLPSGAEIRDKISEVPAFQKDGKFDMLTYKSTLSANNYTMGSFEKMVSDDLLSNRWEDFFRERTHFATEELREMYLQTETKRNIKYVLISAEAARKAVVIPAADITKYLSDAQKMALVKTRFDAKKEQDFKGKTLDQVKGEIAQDLLAGDRIEEVSKAAEKLANQIAPLIAVDSKADAKIAAQFKAYSLDAKTTGLVVKQGDYLPGLGSQKDLIQEAFGPTPFGTRAKVFKNGQTAVVALVIDSKEADLSKFEQEWGKLSKQVSEAKNRNILDDWTKKAMEKAKIETNPAVIGDKGKLLDQGLGDG